MKVVLLEDLPGKGKAGEIREVSKGYAKNFLLPRSLALVATPAVMKQVKSRLERQKLEEEIDREKLAELAQQIEGRELRFKARTGAGERLFGSITAADIAAELSQAAGSPVDKKRIDIEKPLRQTGSYEVAIKLASDIRPKITVVIEEEETQAIEVEADRAEEKRPKAKEKGEEADPEKEVERKQPKAKETGAEPEKKAARKKPKEKKTKAKEEGKA